MTDYCLQGIVGGTCCTYEFIPGSEDAIETEGQGLGPRYDLMPDQGRFRAKDPGPNSIQLVPAQVVQPIAGCGIKIRFPYPFLLEGF